jgi:hypothetical protein
LPPTLQIQKKKEKDLYPPLNFPKTKRMDLYSPPINKSGQCTPQLSFFFIKKRLVPTPQPSKEQTKERFTPIPTLQVFKKT